MKQRFVLHWKRQVNPADLMLLLFALEGALLQFTGSINGFGNNLFATNLGATDAQIGMIQMVPNLVALLLMLPLGILSDRLKSSRTVPMIMLWLMVAGYALMGIVPMTAGLRMPMFFMALAFTAGGPVLYNAQWQNFFGDVIEVEKRNNVLTARNRFMFIVGIAAPILCGVLMGLCGTTEGKLMVLQVFFFICAAVTLVQLAVVGRIKTPRREHQGNSISLYDVGTTIRSLAASRSFAMFFIPAVLFYMSWQMDWSMWYIGQTQYLGLNEAELSITSGVFNVGQLVAVGVLSKIVRKRGADYTFSFAALGLMFCPLIMMFCSILPQGARFITFTVLMTVLNAPQCAVNLCAVQILLRVSPQENRSLAVSLYTMTTTLTNCFMPLAGVQLYTLLGADYRAMICFNVIVLVFRIFTLSLLVWRYKRLRGWGMLPDTQLENRTN